MKHDITASSSLPELNDRILFQEVFLSESKQTNKKPEENYQKKGREAGLSSMMHHNGIYFLKIVVTYT